MWRNQAVNFPPLTPTPLALKKPWVARKLRAHEWFTALKCYMTCSAQVGSCAFTHGTCISVGSVDVGRYKFLQICSFFRKHRCGSCRQYWVCACCIKYSMSLNLYDSPSHPVFFFSFLLLTNDLGKYYKKMTVQCVQKCVCVRFPSEWNNKRSKYQVCPGHWVSSPSLL